MENELNEYSLNYCEVCGKFKALLNGKCVICQDKLKDKNNNIPDILKDIFKTNFGI